MRLPALSERFNGFSARKKLLFLTLGILSLLIVILLVEVLCCLGSKTCLLKLGKTFPFIEELGGVQETDLAYRRGSLALSKSTGGIFVSGEIVEVREDRLVIKSENGSGETFLVEEGSEFIISDSLTDIDMDGRDKYLFNGDNLPDFLSPGDFLTPAHFINSKISSRYSKSGKDCFYLIIVLRE